MGYSTPDVYYNPEKFDLTIIGHLVDPDSCYSFDDLIVFQHNVGKELYYAIDSGCSCPSPFENYTTITDLGEPITDDNWAEFQKDVEEHACPYRYENGRMVYTRDPQAADKTELLAKVARLLREQS